MNINSDAKRIICFGDSLTWGQIPGSEHRRYPVNKRWTGILQISLGENYEVIEEGLNGRTLDSKDPRPGKEGRCGSKYLIPCLKSHDPIDLVILMLGTNDLKDVFDVNSASLRRMLENKYIKPIQTLTAQVTEKPPRLLMISPPGIDVKKDFARSKYANSKPKYRALKSVYQKLSERYGTPLIKCSKIITTGADGVHFDHTGHKTLAKEIHKVIQQDFKNL